MRTIIKAPTALEVLTSLTGDVSRDEVRFEVRGPRIMNDGYVLADVNGLRKAPDGCVDLLIRGKRHGTEGLIRYNPVTGEAKDIDDPMLWPEDLEVVERYEVTEHYVDRFSIVMALMNQNHHRLLGLTNAQDPEMLYGVRPQACRFDTGMECLAAHVFGDAFIDGEKRTVLLHCDFRRGVTTLEHVNVPEPAVA